MIAEGFEARIGSVPIRSSVMVDKTGSQTDDCRFCSSIEIEFEDDFAATLTTAELDGLPIYQRMLVAHAPSRRPL